MGIDSTTHGGTAASAHCVWIEEPDIVFVQPIGLLSLEHLRLHAAAKLQLADKIGYTFTHLDCSAMTGVPAETRREILKLAGIVPTHAVAITGASYHITVIMSVLAKGVDTLLKLERPVRFFHSKAEADAWFSELRAQREAPSQLSMTG